MIPSCAGAHLRVAPTTSPRAPAAEELYKHPGITPTMDFLNIFVNLPESGLERRRSWSSSAP
jgi:hypothetical protein